jgi:hypothetical protein
MCLAVGVRRLQRLARAAARRGDAAGRGRRIEPSDAGAALDAGDEAGAEVLLASDFESGPGCGPWLLTRLTAVRDTTTARSGEASCKVCATGLDPRLTGLGPGRPPGTYYLTTWVRNESAVGWRAKLIAPRAVPVDGSEPPTSKSNSGQLSSEWTLAQVATEVAYEAREISVRLYLNSAEVGNCYFLDDLALAYEPAEP